MGRVGSGHTKRTHGQRWSRVRAARLRVVSGRQFPLRSTTSSCSRDYGHTRRAGRRRLPRRPTPAARRPRRRRCRPTRATRAAARRNLATVLRFTLRPDAFRHRRHSLGNLLYFLEKNGRKLDAQFRRYASAQTHTHGVVVSFTGPLLGGIEVPPHQNQDQRKQQHCSYVCVSASISPDLRAQYSRPLLGGLRLRNDPFCRVDRKTLLSSVPGGLGFDVQPTRDHVWVVVVFVCLTKRSR